VASLPEPLSWLVRRCLNKDPAGRPPARDVLGDLVAAGARLVGPMPPMVSALAADEETFSSPRAPAVPPKPRHGSGEGLIAARPASGAGPASGPRSARHGSHRSRWRRRLPILLAAALLVAAAGVLAFNLPRHGAAPQRLAGHQSPVAAEIAARKHAITWILQQVSRAAVVSCDPQLCGDLVSAGFPSANVLPLGPGSNDPLGSALVVATEPIRAHFGSRLASVYAPAVIASFGSRAARIDIRLVYPGGAAAYNTDERAALPDRKTAGAELLANSNIKASATARAQLLSGDVDPRLPQLLAIMAGRHPVSIVDFGSQSPGGGPASLLRSVDLATVDSVAHMTRSAYLGWMQTFIDAQRAQYHPSVQQVPLHTGQPVLRIGFGAPSPLS
jgi:hypothetical protein